ncbi:hypothetical protein [Actinokineospora sp.]|uniref:hypothetical protein n=1 Tax=Actinokineospora sp. TaxID=1872133 RepID=UPI004037EEC1
MDDEVEPHRLGTDELAARAASGDGWNNVPALAELARRAPVVALAIATTMLTCDDALLAARAPRVVAEFDERDAHAFMATVGDDPAFPILAAIVEILAVDSPVDPGALPGVLRRVARRLAAPRSGREQDLANLFFRQYPHLAPP